MVGHGCHNIRNFLVFSTVQDTPAVTGTALKSLYIVGEVGGSQGNSKWDRVLRISGQWLFTKMQGSPFQSHTDAGQLDTSCSHISNSQCTKGNQLTFWEDGKEEEDEEVGWVCPWRVTGPVLLEKREQGEK